jgi:hypothetical protein
LYPLLHIDAEELSDSWTTLSITNAQNPAAVISCRLKLLTPVLKKKIDKVYAFCQSVGLPVTLALIGIIDPTEEIYIN